MATASPEISDCAGCYTPSQLVAPAMADIVRDGLGKLPKQLPPWLFYDEAGSLLFEEITRLPEYYLTRTERLLFERHAAEMIAAAACGRCLQVIELGAGSADKTRTLLAAALDYQGAVEYSPVDVSETALVAARERIEAELPGVEVREQVADYTHGLQLSRREIGERRLVLSIGSSIGNFARHDAIQLLAGLRASLDPGDSLLIGLDLAPVPDGKSIEGLIAAYDDAQGVTAAFNKNMLVRLNRELGANFDLETFRHLVRWNDRESRIEMHLESLRDQTVRIQELDLNIRFAQGETIHTENSCKYRTGEAEAMLLAAGFNPTECWNDADGWFAIHLACVPSAGNNRGQNS